MARIYYKEEKLLGESIRHPELNNVLFQRIMDNATNYSYDIPKQEKRFLKLFKTETPTFRVAEIRKDNIYYNAPEGQFFLPNAIILYDIGDYNFPTEFYFVAQIGEQIELRQCRGGENVQWYQIPDLHMPVTDSYIINKITNSLMGLSSLLDSQKQLPSQFEPLPIQTEEYQRAGLDQKQKEAYLTLVQHCMPLNDKKDDILFYIDQLQADCVANLVLYDLIEYLDDNGIHFVISLDWKSDISDLKWRINSALEQNFHQSIPLPFENNYPGESTISEEGVFTDFDRCLREKNFQISLIDTQSDEYIILVHPISDMHTIKDAVTTIGYAYQHIEDISL